ncbi:MAG: Gfo/Idh/MocA family oxidoreductase [Bryobacteraceae bacterium]
MTPLAIIGLGNIGRVHLDNLQSLRGCRVAGVFDVQAPASDPGVFVYPSLAALLQDPAAVAVVIATPSDTHAELTERALAAGKHVFVEKPLAGTLQDAKRITDAARQHPSRVVQAGFCERFNVNYLEARRAVLAGSLGELRAIQTSRVAPYGMSNPAWEMGVLDTAVHNLDLILWLKQAAPVSVLARGARVYPESISPDAVTTVLTFADGSIAVDHIAWMQDGGFPLNQCARSRMTLQGSDGYFEIDLTDRPSAIRTKDGYRAIDSVIIGAPEYAGCLKLQFEYFLRSVEEGAPVLAPVEDALLTERVALAALESLRSGREVHLAE